MEQFYQDLTTKIKDAVKTDMKKILEEVGNEKIYVTALVTDSDCITLFLAVNTYEYLNENGGLESEEKWLPDEWGYSDGKDSALTKLSELLYEHDKSLSYEADKDEQLEKYYKQFFEAAISALEQLKTENIFGKESEEVICFVSISDDDQAEDIENMSAKRLNNPELISEFLNRYSVNYHFT